MKKLIYILSFIFILSGINVQAQSDSIQIKKKLGTVFQQNGKNLTVGKMLKIMETNPEAYSEMKKANTNYTFGMIFSGAGGFLVGWPIGTYLGGGDPDWVLAAVGAGLIVAGITITTGFTKHAKNAVTIYNRGLRSQTKNIPEMTLNIAPNGIGFRISF